MIIKYVHTLTQIGLSASLDIAGQQRYATCIEQPPLHRHVHILHVSTATGVFSSYPLSLMRWYFIVVSYIALRVMFLFNQRVDTGLRRHIMTVDATRQRYNSSLAVYERTIVTVSTDGDTKGYSKKHRYTREKTVKLCCCFVSFQSRGGTAADTGAAAR